LFSVESSLFMQIVEFAFIIGSINYTRHGLPYSGVIKKVNKEEGYINKIHVNLILKLNYFSVFKQLELAYLAIALIIFFLK
jgi:hypothetical protein